MLLLYRQARLDYRHKGGSCQGSKTRVHCYFFTHSIRYIINRTVLINKAMIKGWGVHVCTGSDYQKKRERKRTLFHFEQPKKGTLPACIIFPLLPPIVQEAICTTNAASFSSNFSAAALNSGFVFTRDINADGN